MICKVKKIGFDYLLFWTESTYLLGIAELTLDKYSGPAG